MGDKRPPTFHDAYDLSPDQREIADWRYKKRLELRNKWWNMYGDPNYRSHIVNILKINYL